MATTSTTHPRTHTHTLPHALPTHQCHRAVHYCCFYCPPPCILLHTSRTSRSHENYMCTKDTLHGCSFAAAPTAVAIVVVFIFWRITKNFHKWIVTQNKTPKLSFSFIEFQSFVIVESVNWSGRVGTGLMGMDAIICLVWRHEGKCQCNISLQRNGNADMLTTIKNEFKFGGKKIERQT